MKVFLTGATGFVGSFVAEALLGKGHQVKCLVRPSSNLRWLYDLKVEYHYGSLRDRPAMQCGMADCDYIIHLAGLTKARTEAEYFSANYEGTKNILDAAIDSGLPLKRFLLVSSQAAVGPSPTLTLIDEKTEPRPLTYYGKSKLAAEQCALSFVDKIPITIVRPPVVYGPRDIDVLEFFRAVKWGVIPQLQGKNRYLSLIYVKDLAQGMIAALESPAAEGNIYFLANSQSSSWEQLGRVALNIFGRKGVRLYVPRFLLESVVFISENYSKLTGRSTILNKQKILEMEPEFWTCNPQRAKADFGFEATTSLEDGFRETIGWYREQGWL